MVTAAVRASLRRAQSLPCARRKPEPGSRVSRGTGASLARQQQQQRPRSRCLAAGAELPELPEQEVDQGRSEALYRCDDIVRHLWENIDLDNSEEALAFFHDDVVYSDLIYEEPFVGKEAVAKFLNASRANAPEGLRFVLDDVSDGEDACGFTWHLELEINGENRKITKGLSLYRVDPNDRRIISVTDAPESFIKIGSAGLKIANLAFKAAKFAKSLSVDRSVIREGFEKVGFVGGTGTRVKWGVLRVPIGEDEVFPGEEASERRRAEAATELVNIDGEERARRYLAGGVGMVITSVLAFLLAGQPWYVRYFGVSPLLGLSLGFLVSGQQGL